MFFSFRIRVSVLCAAVLAAAAALFTILSAPVAAQPASANAAARVVCLTFDDGPSANTPEVLEALRRHGVNATFFVTAQNEERLPLLAEAARDGNLIAVHTYSHDFSNIYSGEDAFWADIERIAQVIEQQTGARASALRFAGGSSNTIASRSLMRALTAQCPERGYEYFDWNVDTRDALGTTRSADYIARRAVDGAREHPEAVILMHDGPANSTAAAALDIIIPELKAQGCEFVTVDKLTKPIHHSMR